MSETPRTTLWAFVVASVATFIVTLDNLVETTALPVIRADLGASIGGYQSPNVFVDGLTPALWLGAIVALCALGALLIPGRRAVKRAEPAEAPQLHVGRERAA